VIVDENRAIFKKVEKTQVKMAKARRKGGPMGLWMSIRD
jgi:hypothetical protein